MQNFWAILGLATALVMPAVAQIEVRKLGDDLTGEQLAQRLIGGGVRVFNVQYIGSQSASARFCKGEEAVGFDSGILLTTGDALNVLPPNDSPSAGTDNELDGDTDLDSLIPGFQTFDASVLEFDFVAEGSEVQFNYVFASEEYNEFVDSSFNDVFGFFVNGVNFALIPGTATPVSINKVNNGYSEGESAGPCMNCLYFVDNAGTNTVRETQMDGLTTVLTFTAPVIPGQTNHLKIAVADAGDGILDSAVFLQAGSLTSGTSSNCVTRDARFWFTHPSSDNAACANLRDALQIGLNLGCDGLGLGFLEIPTGFRNNDNVRDVEDALVEALGFYYRSGNRTGELAGQQSWKLKASKLCRERKRLVVEYLSALANTAYLGTAPESCTYPDGDDLVPFPASLLSDTRSILASNDVVAIREQIILLQKFNRSGVVNNLPAHLVECAASAKKALKSLSRDPTSKFTCPGLPSSCASAEPVVFQNTDQPFALPVFKSKANMTKLGTTRAFWRIGPDVALAGRRFTVDTFGSNFDTLITVFRGTCPVTIENGIEQEDRTLLELVTFNDDAELTPQSKVSFTADGGVDYTIQIEGGTGKLKLRITSP